MYCINIYTTFINALAIPTLSVYVLSANIEIAIIIGIAYVKESILTDVHNTNAYRIP